MAIEKLNLSWVDQSRAIEPTAIVLHWWQMPSWLVGIKWFLFALKRKKLSVQFTVMKDGKIYQLTDSPDVWCRHARCANDSSIGIELQGLGSHELDRQERQFEATVNLVADLCNQYRINPEFKVRDSQGHSTFFGITSHKEVDKFCSGIRMVKKKDVHDAYVSRVVVAVTNKLKF